MNILTQAIIDSARNLELVFGDCTIILRAINHIGGQEVSESFALNINMRCSKELTFMRVGNKVVVEKPAPFMGQNSFQTQWAEKTIILPTWVPLIKTLGGKDTDPTLDCLEEGKIYSQSTLDRNWF